MNATTSHGPGLTATSVLCRHAPPRVHQVEVAGETVVFDSETGSLHLLDPLATIIWTLLDGKATLGETSDQVAEIFGRPADEVFGHVRELAQRLDRAGLVRQVAGEPA